MKAKSASAKGKRFEKAVAQLVSQMGFGLTRRESGSGNGLYKGDIAWSIPKTPELKNQPSKFPKQLIDWIEQSEAQALRVQPWVLILRDPRKPEAILSGFAVLDMHEYLKLEMHAKAPKSKEPDRDLKHRLERMKRLAHECMGLAEEREAQWKFRDLKMAAGDVLKLFDHI